MRKQSSIALALGALLFGCGTETSPPDPGPPEPGWFEEEARASGLVFTYRSGHDERHFMPEIMGGGAALFDMDDDGDLDAYLVQGGALIDPEGTSATNRLFANDGAGAFTDVTNGSGSADPRYGMGVACADVDNDGKTDLYVTNVGRNTLLLNEGGGRFRDATENVGGAHTGWACSAAFFDHDRDGQLDLFVTNYLEWSVATELPCMDALGRADYCSPKNYKTPARDVFYANDGGRLLDRSEPSGIGSTLGTGLGVACGDFDGDGWQDVFVANDGMSDHLWRNLGDGTFQNVAHLWGCATDANGLEKAGMGVAVADVDDDLDLDVLVCNLAGETDSMYLNQGGFFGDRTAAAGLGATSRPYTRFGMAWLDFDNDGRLDLYQANGRVQRASMIHEGDVGDPYAEENLLFRGLGDARFEEVLPRGGVDPPLIATSRAAAFGDVDNDGALDVVVVNRDAPAHLLRNVSAGDGHWVLLDVRETSGGPALGAELTLEADGRTLRRDVRAAYSYLASNDPRIHVGLGTTSAIDSVRVRWTDGKEEVFGPFETDRVHRLARGEGR